MAVSTMEETAIAEVLDSLDHADVLFTFELDVDYDDALGEQSSETVKKCLVCGNDAGKHNYYGGQVCNSCRAFFRRAVVSNNYPGFKCMNALDKAKKNEGPLCKINSKSRKSCQLCRFKACIEAGMQPKWIMSNDEIQMRKERKTVDQMVKPARSVEKWDLSEAHQLTRHTLDYTLYHLAKFFAKHSLVYDDVVNALNQGSSLNFYSMKMLDKYVNNVCFGLYMNMPETKRLPLDDSQEIVVGNFNLVISLLHATFLSQHDSEHFRCQFLKKIESEAKVDSEIGRLREFFASNQNAIRYDQLYASPWASNMEKEMRHEVVTKKILDWLPRPDPNGPRDDTALVLMLYILLFSTETLVLQNRREAESVQMKYIQMLHQYLKHAYPDRSQALFLEGMMLSSYAREAWEIRQKRLPV